MTAMFDTETMAELCVKQGLLDEALAIYRRLADLSEELATRRRYEERMAALGKPREARPMDTPGLRVDRRGDEVEIEWRLPPNVSSPALQLLLLRRTPTGIAVEPRTTPP